VIENGLSRRKLLGYSLLGLLPKATRADEGPPRGLLKTIAKNGSRFHEELGRYTYRQSFRFRELDRFGAPGKNFGDYLEVRDVTFTPDGERLEEFVKGPVNRLKRIIMTEEDFDDLRNMQPFVLTEDTLWRYDTKYQGDELVAGRDCYVYRIKPKQVLHGQRFLDGQIWVDKKALQVVQAAGLPVPQHHKTEGGNLFARFTTLYAPVDGEFWFPVETRAKDTLPFSSGLQNVEYEVDYAEYKRFSAESVITFGDAAEDETPPQR